MELLWLYLMGGGKLHCQRDISVACIRVCQALKEFKAEVRGLAGIGLTSTDRAIFLPSQAREYPLQRLGIQSFLPSIRGHIIISQALREKLNVNIAAFAHKLIPGKRKIFADHGRMMISHVMWNP